MKSTWTIGVLVCAASAQATRLAEVRTVDDETVMVHWIDSVTHYKEVTQGAKAYSNPEGQAGDTVETFGKPLDTQLATTPGSYEVLSEADGSTSMRPVKVFRKTKVNGSPWAWPEPPVSLEHTLYLRLPKKLLQGRSYTLRIASGTNTDVTEKRFTFDAFRSVSEAIHVNLIGYRPDVPLKSADLYMWLGDGGARDYSAYSGRKVYLVDAKTGKRTPAGKVAFWKKEGPDCGKWNFTQSDVWTCDATAPVTPGTYRLAIEGIGCSRDFASRRNVYREPFGTSVRGFYFMRIGESMDFVPVPRQPRYIQNVDPPGFKVYRTTFGPGHPDWGKRGGDPWDVRDWSMYNEPGNPTNPKAYGGHSDAADWDRHPGHISIIWDMLLPYILSNGKLGEDNLGIRESGNGIPDLIDEARNEVDFWLRLRDGNGGYSFGLGNPSKNDTVMFQAVAHPYMAWASACNSAMLADAFRIAGKKDLMVRYRNAAIEAWNKANGQGLDFSYGIGNGTTRGRDLKMMAAAFLYSVTGDRKYEDAMAKECVIDGPTAFTEKVDRYNQLWGCAAYLMCQKYQWRPTHYRELAQNMQKAVVREAKLKNVANSLQWPSRRSSDTAYGWFQTTQEVQRVCVAHAVSTDPKDKAALHRALLLEADWGLGRNPMNMAQMTGLSCRCVTEMYTSGRNDGIPGVHPGHTPYMNAGNWGAGFMADPMYYANKGYPSWDRWPQGEAYWPVRYCYSNNEFTPQQSMRGKMCLLGYLYSLSK